MRDTLIDTQGIADFVDRAVQQILTWDDEPSNIALVGIRTLGVPLARRIQNQLVENHGSEPPLGILDITLYRDDLHEIAASPLIRGTEIDFDIQGRTLVLVDDVIFTGRTIRAAIDQLIDFGRPRAIKLVVLVDRGHRELPIAPDFAGCTVKTQRDQDVNVTLVETDGPDAVHIVSRSKGPVKK